MARATQTYHDALKRTARLRARVTEVVYLNGEGRLNIVLTNGKPRTLRFALSAEADA